jgi:hypothetical protein
MIKQGSQCHSTEYQVIIRPKGQMENLMLLSRGVEFLTANI